MNKTTFFLVLTSFCFMMQLQAAPKKSIDACEKNSRNNIEVSQCLDKVVDAADRELQTWINNQTFILEELASTTGRTAALSMFERAQRDFISYRENNCRWQYLAISPGTGASSAYKKCYILISKSRIEELSQINP